jgi:hypothetical protein
VPEEWERIIEAIQTRDREEAESRGRRNAAAIELAEALCEFMSAQTAYEWERVSERQQRYSRALEAYKAVREC